MKHLQVKIGMVACLLAANTTVAKAQNNVIDEVAWVVGDEPILKSEIEAAIQDMRGEKLDGDPYCFIPEQLAIQKLFLHQAALDSITIPESSVSQKVEERLQTFINMAGSREKLEEYQGRSIAQIRDLLREQIRDLLTSMNMREKLVKDIKVTPADVRSYFKDLPADSVPYVPTEVEVEILTNQPRIPQTEIDHVKNELREYTDRINEGKTSFSTMAIMYSEDPGSARKGGELGYIGRAVLDPAFAAVAFNLTDPTKISKIVQSEYGYHIIQLIGKQGDKVNVRHILRKPRVPAQAFTESTQRLDSIADDIRKQKFTFEEAVSVLSDDKNTRNNRGLMINRLEDDTRTSRFRLQDLPQDVAKVVNNMQIGEISKAFVMTEANGREACAIVKLKNKTNGHKATMADDFQLMKNIVLQKRQEEAIDKWIREKQKTTYVKIDEKWRNCDFKYPGWVK